LKEIERGGFNIVFARRYSKYPEVVAVKRIAKKARALSSLEKKEEVENFAMMSRV
jgi:hypothetical protein